MRRPLSERCSVREVEVFFFRLLLLRRFFSSKLQNLLRQTPRKFLLIFLAHNTLCTIRFWRLSPSTHRDCLIAHTDTHFFFASEKENFIEFSFRFFAPFFDCRLRRRFSDTRTPEKKSYTIFWDRTRPSLLRPLPNLAELRSPRSRESRNARFPARSTVTKPPEVTRSSLFTRSGFY